MCSTTLAMLMRQLMTLFSRTLRKRILDRVKDDKDTFVDVGSIILHMDTMPQLATAFTDGSVTVQKEASNAGKQIELVQQVNTLSLQSHIARINTPLPKSGKYPQCRNIDPSSLFSICPSKTPEGEGAGLIQTLAILSHVRTGTEMEDVASLLLAIPQVKPLTTSSAGFRTLVYLNSDPLGRTNNPLELIDVLRAARRSGELPYTMTCYLTSYGVLVTTDMGVITFPLINLDAISQLPAAVAEAELGGRNLWQTLVDHGIIEYTDAWEAQDYTVSFTMPKEKDHPYTHLAPHPTSFFCTAAGTIPFANHNQVRIGHAEEFSRSLSFESLILTLRILPFTSFLGAKKHVPE